MVLIQFLQQQMSFSGSVGRLAYLKQSALLFVGLLLMFAAALTPVLFFDSYVDSGYVGLPFVVIALVGLVISLAQTKRRFNDIGWGNGKYLAYIALWAVVMFLSKVPKTEENEAALMVGGLLAIAYFGCMLAVFLKKGRDAA